MSFDKRLHEWQKLKRAREEAETRQAQDQPAQNRQERDQFVQQTAEEYIAKVREYQSADKKSSTTTGGWILDKMALLGCGLIGAPLFLFVIACVVGTFSRATRPPSLTPPKTIEEISERFDQVQDWNATQRDK